jgi:hypothetical protein
MCLQADVRDTRLRNLLPSVRRVVPHSSILLDIGTDAADLITIASFRDRTVRSEVFRAAWKHINVPAPSGNLDVAVSNQLDQLCREAGFDGFADALRAVVE